MRKTLTVFFSLIVLIVTIFSMFYYNQKRSEYERLKESVIKRERGYIVDDEDLLPAKKTYPWSFPKLSSAEIHDIAKKIYANECGSLESNLLFWSTREDFPSLGIGHFIWFGENADPGFEETFPELIHFMLRSKVDVPIWLIDRPAPWSNRAEFLMELKSARMIKLRDFLVDTMDIQADFIIYRAQKSLEDIFDSFDVQHRRSNQRKIKVLLHAYNGVYAVVDYINFKGTGLSLSERYNDQGWGLKQVIEEMPDDITEDNALRAFAQTAERILTLRIANAPQQRNERKWLEGWKKRVRIYAKPVEYERVYWE